MGDQTFPGVHIDEPIASGSIVAAPTSTAAIIGATHYGPVSYDDLVVAPTLIQSYADYERVFGGSGDLILGGEPAIDYVAHAARAFFENGGRSLYVQRVFPMDGSAESTSYFARRRVGDTNGWTARWPGTGGADVDVTVIAAQSTGRLTVSVRSGDRVARYDDLVLDPQQPRSIFTVLDRHQPEDPDCPVWLDADPRTPSDLSALTIALLDPQHQGRLEAPLIGDPLITAAALSDLSGLELLNDVSIVLMPDTARLDADSAVAATSALIAHCERRRDRVAIIDPPRGSTVDDVRRFRAYFESSFAALYYPWIERADPRLLLPPSGHVAGIYARVDREHGVHRAPANEVLNGVARFETEVTAATQGVLNPEGINVLRWFPGRGNRVWGARTMSSDPEWKYVNVRRLLIFIEHSISTSIQWVVFEPNDEPLWARVRSTIAHFLTVLWQNGALAGAKPEHAFYVRCDRSTMTQNDLDDGRLICEIGVAPIKPAEFVIIRIGHRTAAG